jgi:hypothetical protein
MPDGSEQRRFPRYAIQLPLLHAPRTPTPTQTGVGWTHNLSEGGACVELDRRLSAPTRLQVRFQTDCGAIEVETQVVWEVEREGGGGGAGSVEGGVLHGLAFTPLAPDQLLALRDLLLSQRRERRAGVRLPVDLAVTSQPKGEAGSPLQGRMGDMSRGGLLLRLTQALPPGTVLEVTLLPPSGPVTAEGEVVWVDPPHRQTFGEPIRHGVRFTALGWSTSLSLALLLAEPA